MADVVAMEVPAGASAEYVKNIENKALLQPLLDEGEEVLHREEDVEFFVEQKSRGKGVFCVTTERINFMSYEGEDSDQNFVVTYPQVILHAISRDTQGSFARACIYAQLDLGGGPRFGTPSTIDDENQQGDENEVEDEDELLESTEVHIVPVVESALQPIFKAMSDGSALHPDPNMVEEEQADNPFANLGRNDLSFEQGGWVMAGDAAAMEDLSDEDEDEDDEEE